MNKISVSSLVDINSSCEMGLELDRFNENDVKIIKEQCVWSNKNLTSQEIK